MKFIVTRSQRTEESLRFFRSIRVWRDDTTEELVVLWRPARFLSIFGGLVVGLPIIALVAATFWIQYMAPGVAIGFADVALPWRWGGALTTWQDYQRSPSGNSPVTELRQPSEPPTSEPPTAEETGPLLPGINPALKDFFEKNGTQRKLQGIKSATVRGVVTLATGQVLDFTMVKKFPGQMRLTITDRGTNVQLTKLSRDGQGWQWIGDPFTNGVRRLAPGDAAALAREVWHSGAVLELFHRMSAIEVVDPPPAAAIGRTTLRVLLPGGMTAETFLNAESARPEQVRINFLFSEQPSAYDISVVEWKVVEGVPEPASIQVRVNGAKLLDCRFTEIAYNTGAYDVLFVPPAGAPQVDGMVEGMVPSSQIGGVAPVLPAVAQPSSSVSPDAPPVVP